MLYLVRHGRTAANASGLLLGRLDVPLDEEGERQADALARRLANELEPPVRVVSSPLERARQTAAAVAGAMGASVEIDDRWIELDYGRYDGVALDDVPAELWSAWQADEHYEPAGGESLAALGTRVRAAADDLAEEAGQSDVVVVSHVSPIKAAAAWALGVDDGVAWRMFLSPASITRVRTSGRRPSLVGFNDVAHLG